MSILDNLEKVEKQLCKNVGELILLTDSDHYLEYYVYNKQFENTVKKLGKENKYLDLQEYLQDFKSKIEKKLNFPFEIGISPAFRVSITIKY